MKALFICICCALVIGAHAQDVVNKSYPAAHGQHVKLKFDYPGVKVSTWDKNEVAVTAHVNINDHENDSAFELESSVVNGTIVISDHIKGLNSLPRRYTVVVNGKKMIYRNRADYQEATRKGGVEKAYESSDIDITIEVKVPAYCQTDINAVYGMVEMIGFNASVNVDATYGGIDATLNPAQTGKLKATTSYGQIYSNLDLKFTDHTEQDFFNSITAEPGKGPAYDFTSTYGRIYIRKP